MNNAIQILKYEHQLLTEAIEVGSEIQKLKGELYHHLMHDLIVFFRNFTELYHHPKEELLFKVLWEEFDYMSENLMLEIDEDHDDFKYLVAEMENSYIANTNAVLRNVTRKYFEDLTNHIKLEDTIIFDQITTFIPEKRLEKLYDQFLEFDNKAGEKEPLREILYKLRGTLELMKTNEQI